MYEWHDEVRAERRETAALRLCLAPVRLWRWAWWWMRFSVGFVEGFWRGFFRRY